MPSSLGPDYAAAAEAYARQAVKDRKRHCKWVRLACKRHLVDLKRKGKDWPYEFRPRYANSVCAFVEDMPHVEGKWSSPTLILEPWQVFILSCVFGWRRKVDGRRLHPDARVRGPSPRSPARAGRAAFLSRDRALRFPVSS